MKTMARDLPTRFASLPGHRGLVFTIAASCRRSREGVAERLQELVLQLWRAGPGAAVRGLRHRTALTLATGDLRGRSRPDRTPLAVETRADRLAAPLARDPEHERRHPIPATPRPRPAGADRPAPRRRRAGSDRNRAGGNRPLPTPVGG
ncbi:hypothetical protein CKY51_05020 [Xanthomonas maliensis]|nr:hypothetical protein CKY51_05020 [Xanthomonas maliensis]